MSVVLYMANLHLLIVELLLDWKRGSLYQGDGDFLFPSIRLNGTKPLSPDSLLKKAIRPALIRAGIEGKIIGWHNFRHTLGTLLRAIRTDIKVAQDLLRHANSRTTPDIYTHAVSQQKRDANTKVVELLLPGRVLKTSAPFSTLAPLKRSGLDVEVVHLDGVVGGPDRDRTDDLFHAITTIVCNPMILGASVAT